MVKIALVTGASSTLGKAVAQALSLNGYRVHLVTSSQLDLTSDVSCQKAVTNLIRSVKKLDLVVNVAGVTASGPGLSSSSSDLSHLIDVNCVASFRLLKSTAHYLSKSNPGRFIVICSLSGHVPFPNFSLYTASKFGLRGLCLSLHHELLNQNIYITCISPGAIASPNTPQPSNSARARLPLLNWLLPLTSTDQVVQAVINIIQSPKPISEVLVGLDAVTLGRLFRFLPGGIWYRLQRFIWQKQQ